jgi:hypothetical protein
MKRILLLLVMVGGCGGDNCTAQTACGGGLKGSYKFCTSGASDCYYVTNDGERFHCTTCGDCTAARDQVASWCAAEPAATTTGKGGTSGDNGAICSGTSTTCPSGNGSFQACASPDGSACSIKGSDGTVFKCNSCSDCTEAGTQAAMWCEGGTTGTSGSTTGTSGNTTGTSGSTTGTTMTSCDVVSQNCGSGMKCVGVVSSTSTVVTGTCMTDGSVGEGQECLAPQNDTTYEDNCKGGLICDNRGANAVSLCRRICTSDSECRSGQRCMNAFGPGTAWGWCEPTCTPFAANSCPVNNECSGNSDDIAFNTTQVESGFFMCRPKGTGAPFVNCNSDADCGPNLWCDWSQTNATTGFCQGICDSTHTCPTPAPGTFSGTATNTCAPFSDQSGAGYCVIM